MVFWVVPLFCQDGADQTQIGIFTGCARADVLQKASYAKLALIFAKSGELGKDREIVFIIFSCIFHCVSNVVSNWVA